LASSPLPLLAVRIGVRCGNRILIQLPGLSQADKDSAKTQIQKTAFLEFRMVHERSNEIVDERTGEIHEPVPAGYELLKHVEQLPNNQTRVEYEVVKKKPENGLAGDIVKSSMVVRCNLGEPQIDFSLTEDGAKKFAQTTRENIGHRLAIVLDGELYSAPTIQQTITDRGIIHGNFTVEAVQDLVNVLTGKTAEANLSVPFAEVVNLILTA